MLERREDFVAPHPATERRIAAAEARPVNVVLLIVKGHAGIKQGLRNAHRGGGFLDEGVELDERRIIVLLVEIDFTQLKFRIRRDGRVAQLLAALDGLLAMVTQGKGLAGVDKARPWGLILQASGETDFSGYVFLPVTDFKAALGLLELYSTVDADGGIYKLTPKDGKQVSGKSIMGVMMLAAAQGSEITLSASGSDALEALDALAALIANRFEEES